MMKKIISLLCAVICVGMAKAQWTDDITANTLISESGKLYCAHAKASETPNGNIFVSWLSYEGIGQGDDVYSQAMTKLQLLDKNGKAFWENGGIYISKNPTASWSSDFSMVTTSDNCAIIAFSDSRTDPITKQHFKTYVYKIDQEGRFLWGLDGVALPATSNQCLRPRICVTNSGSIIVGYTANETGEFVMNRLNQDGEPVWSQNLSIKGIKGNFVACEEDDFIVVVMGGENSALTAHRYDAYGDEQWNKSITKDAVYEYVDPVIKSDGKDGAIISYMISGEGAEEFYVCLQRIDENGETMMGIKPIRTSDERAAHNGVAFGVDTKNGYILSLWQKALQGYNTLCATKLNLFGDEQWSKNGIVLDSKEIWNLLPDDVIFTEDGGSILFYRDFVDALNSVVMAKKLDQDGTEVWNKEMSEYNFRSRCTVIPSTDQIYTFWIDDRNSDEAICGEVYGQNISYEGNMGVITSIENTQASKGNNVYYDNKTQTLNIHVVDVANSVNVELYSLSGLLLNRYNNLPVSGNKANLTITPLLPGTYVIKIAYGENQNSYQKIMAR